ncbi:MAG: MarR family transcriptional regulator [Candidatus Lokiarchaeota archaeon]|nr:MarR family transcriptional regulator [Candidatus Lokiarchaeota archaeon]
MNSSDKVNFPPHEILTQRFGKNYELIILWMLNNNNECSWSDLQVEGYVKRSTLSLYLKKLIKAGLIEKLDFNKYSITSKGKERFYDITQSKTKRSLSYPPEAILRRRNYKDWLLWMVYNNRFCKWSDFLEDPLRINQSSLSKNLNALIEEDHFILKEEKKYKITQKGKQAYSNMLKTYDLDKQSILEEESKRIEEITKRTIQFFKKFQVKDNEVRFRFLNNVLKLPYEEVKKTQTSEEDFYKIMLFLSINHPSEYPKHISFEEFSDKYKIKKISLEFYVVQIVEEQIYPVKFFKLKVEDNWIYYFQLNEKIEKMLNAVTEEHITKLTYLNKLFEEMPDEKISLTLESTIDAILNDICGNLFVFELKESLKEFLPEYIQYLAYKIEREKRIISVFDKLEGLIWQEVLKYSKAEEKGQMTENFEKLISDIEEAIKADSENKDLYYSKERIMLYFNKYDELLNFFDEIYLKFPNEEKKIELKRAYVLKEMRNLKGGLSIVEKLIEKFPNDKDLFSYKAYWLQYLNDKNGALNIMENLIKELPDNGTYHDNYGEILMSFQEYQKAIEEFHKALEMSSDKWFIFQTYLKLGICYKEIGKFKLAIENLELGKKLSKKSNVDYDTKEKWLIIADLFISEIEQLKYEY